MGRGDATMTAKARTAKSLCLMAPSPVISYPAIDYSRFYARKINRLPGTRTAENGGSCPPGVTTVTPAMLTSPNSRPYTDFAGPKPMPENKPSYQNPVPTVDIILEIAGEGGEPAIVLIERKNPPPGWALPGGFVD